VRFHPKALAFFVAFIVLVLLAIDVRLGVAAILATTVIDSLSFLGPLFSGRGRSRRQP
jgi:hypothetical protein